MSGWGVLLVNLGTPDAPERAAVRRYLREFLMDERVIDVPAIPRRLLVEAIILPKRAARVAAEYAKIWMDEGSPLLVYGRRLAHGVQAELGPEHPVELGMRYGNPSIAAAVSRLRDRGVETIVVMSLFPQYAAATWGSAMAAVYAVAASRWDPLNVRVVPPYYDHPRFLDALAEQAEPVWRAARADRLIVSFHGLPHRHVRRSDPSGAHCLRPGFGCCDQAVDANRYCYRRQCLATARGLTERLGVPDDAWELTFQSRFDKQPWLEPSTEARIEAAATEAPRLCVVCPAFTADCLETIEEIGVDARDQFSQRGGESFELIPTLNDHPSWVRAVVELVRDSAPRPAEPTPPWT